jgi:hypothetical protein
LSLRVKTSPSSSLLKKAGSTVVEYFKCDLPDQA